LSIADKIKSDPRLKAFIHNLLVRPRQARPRWWVSVFVNPIIHKKGKYAIIRRRARMDVLPFRKFSVGNYSVIEDQACINNGMGDVIIGDNVTVGIGCVVIGPVQIGNNVILAQYIGVSGLNHGYADINVPIRDQKCNVALITIGDDCWIGTNAVITAGVSIGKHSVVAAGSVVTKDVPPYTVVGGNPARILRQYNEKNGNWEKPSAGKI
jgi:acetyltransferase-like isoleucine patch superfamily enzyme